MKGRIRVSAKTLDDAITEALVQLGVTSDRLEYDVIEKGSSGFLGIGMKQAVIEAWEKKDKEEEPEIIEERKEISPVVEKPSENNEPIKGKTAEDEKTEAVKEKQEIVKIEEQTVKAVEQFLNDTLRTMGMKVDVSSSIDEDGALYIVMSGEHMGILIGKRGQTLDALQYLANRVANKHQPGYVRVKLDTENYRKRREETLKHLAKNIAHKVKRNRKPVVLEPMNPYERRIIHSALQSDPYVTTHSEGEDPYRKVVVTLKK